MAADRAPDVLGGRVGHALQQRRATHRHPRRAEAALQGVVFDEGGLHRMKLAAARQALDRRHGARPDLDRQGHARADGCPVEPDRAGRTSAAIAGDLGSGEAERPPQRLGQRHPRENRDCPHHAVDFERQRHRVGTDRRGLRLRNCRRYGKTCASSMTPPAVALALTRNDRRETSSSL